MAVGLASRNLPMERWGYRSSHPAGLRESSRKTGRLMFFFFQVHRRARRMQRYTELGLGPLAGG
ncbi:hypothetical protein B0H19DRAFT_1137927, partial [Mycena capillaripes]